MAEAAEAHGNTISFTFDLMLVLDRKVRDAKQKLKKTNKIYLCFRPSGDIFRL